MTGQIFDQFEHVSRKELPAVDSFVDILLIEDPFGFNGQRDFEQLIDIDEMKDKRNWAKSIGQWSEFGTNQKSFDQISDRMIQMIADQKHQVITKLGGRVAEGE